MHLPSQIFSREGLEVDGANGRVLIKTDEDLKKCFDIFNAQLNSALTRAVNAEEEISRRGSEIIRLERELAEVRARVDTEYQRGYQTAMEDTSSWNVG